MNRNNFSVDKISFEVKDLRSGKYRIRIYFRTDGVWLIPFDVVPVCHWPKGLTRGVVYENRDDSMPPFEWHGYRLPWAS